MWWQAAVLIAAIAAPAPTSEAKLVRLLDRTIWTDIGAGRDLAKLSAKERAELKRCKTPTMGFRKAGDSWEQSFYAGIEMRTVYSSAVLTSSAAGDTILFYMAGERRPVETVRLSPDGDVLIEQTRGFRPHTLIKCDLPEASPHKR